MQVTTFHCLACILNKIFLIWFWSRSLIQFWRHSSKFWHTSKSTVNIFVKRNTEAIKIHEDEYVNGLDNYIFFNGRIMLKKWKSSPTINALQEKLNGLCNVLSKWSLSYLLIIIFVFIFSYLSIKDLTRVLKVCLWVSFTYSPRHLISI